MSTLPISSSSAYNDADMDDSKVEIKQVEALIKELQLSIRGSTTAFESLRVQITAMVETLNRLEATYDKNVVMVTRRELQLQLEECERRRQQLFNPNIDLTSSVYSHRQITQASDRFTYTYSPNQYLDFSADEKGLWVMYATEEAKGKIAVVKINDKSFGIEDEWTTSAFKPRVGNAFMVCGVVDATRHGDLKTEEIYYSCDTKTGEERYMSFPL
ncbi:LOW QUALITY PROTEIN: olfactomedin [Lycodopsis pacificus]